MSSNEYFANIWVDNKGFTHNINDLSVEIDHQYTCEHWCYICPLCDINKICPSCKGNVTIEGACGHIEDVIIYRPSDQIFLSG